MLGWDLMARNNFMCVEPVELAGEAIWMQMNAKEFDPSWAKPYKAAQGIVYGLLQWWSERARWSFYVQHVPDETQGSAAEPLFGPSNAMGHVRGKPRRARRDFLGCSIPTLG